MDRDGERGARASRGARVQLLGARLPLRTVRAAAHFPAARPLGDAHELREPDTARRLDAHGALEDLFS